MSPTALAAAIEIPARERTESARTENLNEEVVLFREFLSGDDVAAIKVFRRYHRRLFVYCAKVLGSAERAEDVVSEVWEKLVRLRAAPPEVHNPMGLLLRMSRNLCLNAIRARRDHVSLSDIEERHHPASGVEDATSERTDALLAALEELPFETREILVLNAYCGYRFDEIAEMLGRSPEAVWARASRARTQLRRMVLDALNDGAASSAAAAGELT